MTKLYGEKRSAFDWVEENKRRLSDFHLDIWRYTEPAWREYRSAKAYCDLLRAEELKSRRVRAPCPRLSSPATGREDPLSGRTPSTTRYRGTRNNQFPTGRCARGCTHGLQVIRTRTRCWGVAALTGVLAAKDAMSRHGLGGTIRFFGEPAKKMCGSKPAHAARWFTRSIRGTVSAPPTSPKTSGLSPPASTRRP